MLYRHPTLRSGVQSLGDSICSGLEAPRSLILTVITVIVAAAVIYALLMEPAARTRANVTADIRLGTMVAFIVGIRFPVVRRHKNQAVSRGLTLAAHARRTSLPEDDSGALLLSHHDRGAALGRLGSALRRAVDEFDLILGDISTSEHAIYVGDGDPAIRTYGTAYDDRRTAINLGIGACRQQDWRVASALPSLAYGGYTSPAPVPWVR